MSATCENSSPAVNVPGDTNPILQAPDMGCNRALPQTSQEPNATRILLDGFGGAEHDLFESAQEASPQMNGQCPAINGLILMPSKMS